MRNPVAKHFRKVCRPTIQQSKRRQALMAASVQDEADHAFNSSFSPRSSVISLDSDEDVWDTYQVSDEDDCVEDTNNGIGTSSIDIGGEDDETV